jgi:hypothetical protein
MAGSTTKYQAAPQRDSFEDPTRAYTQAPPSYQAEGSGDALLGQPRSSEDNVPDDFKVFLVIWVVRLWCMWNEC